MKRKKLTFDQRMPDHYAELRSAMRSKLEKEFKGFILDEYLVENACWHLEGLMNTLASILENAFVSGARLPEETREIFTYFLGEERSASWIKEVEDYFSSMPRRSLRATPPKPKLHIRFFNNDDGDGEVIIGPLDGINQDFRGLMRLQFPSKEACDAAFPNHSGRIEDDVVELSVDGVGIVLPHPVKGYKHYYQRWDIFLKE